MEARAGRRAVVLAVAVWLAGGHAARPAEFQTDLISLEFAAPPPAAVAPAPAPDAPAWRRFAVAAPAAGEGAPMIAIVIDDLGVARAQSQRAIELPGPLTLAFFPHAPDLPEQTAVARRAGHELLLHLPMEPDDPEENPGPDALMTGLDEPELRARVHAMFASFGAYVGVNNHMGSRFTGDAPAMAIVLEAVAARGLLFLDSRTTDESVAEGLARDMGIPAAWRDVFIDHEPDGAMIDARLAELEAVARERGFAVGIAHPRPRTLDALAAWLPGIAKRGFILVPISAIVARGQGIDLAATQSGGNGQ
ncbi:MAG: divergent polysaccharide deacetylase family protein [Proteobacteria bacterium]|nr:divergent polysaccharide deacetylase family protein [Pseudomonadota bacterium]